MPPQRPTPYHLGEQPPTPHISAELRPNRTKNHHFLAQAEQRQYAFNTHVNPRSQNLYRYPLDNLQHPQSINIENNLCIDNLYTLASYQPANAPADYQPDKQYNLETWFNRYESGYAQTCAELRQHSTQHPPNSLNRLLQLKLLDILRNPYNRFPHPFSDTEHTPAIIQQIQQRPAEDIRATLASTQQSPQQYSRWLAELYCLLSDAISQPNRLENYAQQLFAHPETRITLHRHYRGKHRYYLPDTAHLIEPNRLWLPVASDLILLVDFKHPNGTRFHLEDNNLDICRHFNHLAIAQSRHYVCGQSDNPAHYR